MRLKILGTKGEIPLAHPHHAKQSGVLIDGTLLLDIGEKSFLKKHPKWILITHLHPDHAYFVRKGKEEDPETESLVYAPEKSRKGVRILRKKRKFGPYTVTPIPTHHSKNVRSQAYLVEKGGKSILYTGDLIWIDKKYRPLFKHIDLVITEGSFVREGGMIRKDREGKIYGHNGTPNLIRLFRPFTDRILFIHFGSWFLKNPAAGRKKLLALGKKYKVTILVGQDGLNLLI